MSLYKSESEKIKPLILQYLENRKHVIDIGVGHAERIVPHAVGVDIRSCPSVDMIIKSAEIYKLHEFSGFEKGFDLVYSSHNLEHLSDDKAALFSWSRLLKDEKSLMILYLPDENYYKEYNPSHLQHYTYESFIDKALREFYFIELVNSFLDVREECYSFCCIFRKKYKSEIKVYY